MDGGEVSDDPVSIRLARSVQKKLESLCAPSNHDTVSTRARLERLCLPPVGARSRTEPGRF
jgi:hypothetical protein